MSSVNTSSRSNPDPALRIRSCAIRPVEQIEREREELRALLAEQRQECRELWDRLLAVESSLAWKLARRLSWLRHALAPANSRRLAGLHRLFDALRLWRREGTRTFARRAVGYFLRDRAEKVREDVAEEAFESAVEWKTSALLRAIEQERIGPRRTGGASVPSERKFSVVFVGSVAREFQSMRYRAEHVIEALTLAGMEARFVHEEQIEQNYSVLLSHDLIVLARVKYDEAIAALLEAARRLGIPVVYDIDDFIFDPWVLPYVEAFRVVSRPDALRVMKQIGKCLDRCDYFTASTQFLIEKATERGKTCFPLRNGMNETQIEASQTALEYRQNRSRGRVVRLGYFSGTRSHQADFRVAYPALMAVLRDEPSARLVVAGVLDLGEFPGLAPFADRLTFLPSRDWRDLPAAIARVDVNLIPLQLNPFNEGKSNLKYFEAGILKIPSIASPTRVLRESIQHDHNGLLAETTEEWYAGLRSLIADRDRRERLGQNAYEHVVREYVPATVSAEVVATYRRILRLHRAKRGIPEHALNVVILYSAPPVDGKETRIGLERANELAAAGHAVTVRIPRCRRFKTAASFAQHLAQSGCEPLFAVQVGGDVPCCDVLLAGDAASEKKAQSQAHRAHATKLETTVLAA